MCHCKYLSSEFWSDPLPHVMRNPHDLSDHSELSLWLDSQEELKSHVLFQTSGSSGQAKWVALSKTALLTSARQVNAHLGVCTGARWGLALPIFHVGGFGILARSFLSGGDCCVYHGAWDPVKFSHFVYTHACEFIALVPTQVEDLISKRCVSPSSLKAVVVGGGALSNDQWAAAKSLGWPVFRSYGMTESASQIATGDEGDGWMKILDGWGIRVSAEGRLEWKGESSFSGYVIDTVKGFELVDPRVDGWFTTQDRVEIKAGNLRMLGRSDSLVKILGELVDLKVLEDEITKRLGCECVLFTQPDKRRGVKLVPVVESENGKSISGFSGLEALEPSVSVPQFPRSPLGKVLRDELRKISLIE